MKKLPNKDFIILNLSDPQLETWEWNDDQPGGKMLFHTVNELIVRITPDLITITGDLAWWDHTKSYINFADIINSFGIPWAFVWGNHDNEGGIDKINAHADMLMKYSNCIFEKGPRGLGCGNYVILIEESGQPVTALIMMDSHDSIRYLDNNGEEMEYWDEFYPQQHLWYKRRVEMLESLGCRDSAVITYFPIHAYDEAWKAAFKDGIDPKTVMPWDSAHVWNKGYEDSFGINHKYVCCCGEDKGFFDLMLSLGSTKHVLCGHDHINNSSINYKGIRLTYATKLGCGCYFRPFMNGGTVLNVGSTGICSIGHEYVDVSDIRHGR